ncbi:TRAP transporter large permease subunit [Chloroflexota bacterium]
MEWYFILALFILTLLGLFLLGFPVAFAFLIVNFLALYLFAGGLGSLFVVIPSALDMLLKTSMLAVPLFILMGEITFHSGIGETVINALDLWVGRLPGRLSLLAVMAGTLFAVLSGSALATTSMLGSVLIPQMRHKNYGKSMSIGPVLGGGGLAVIIPPTFLAIILASLTRVSVASMLMGLVIPGLLLATMYCGFIIMYAMLRPSEAPPHEVGAVSFLRKLQSLRHIMPLGGIIFLVIGVIIIGIASPTEAAALGALGCFVLAASYRKLSRAIITKTLTETAAIACMVFMIIIGSTAFSQLLAYTGASKGLVSVSTQLALPPIALLILMQMSIAILGTFMDQVSIMMIAIPTLLPIVTALGFDLVWFSIVTMINLSVAAFTPPFGLLLFAMKGVVPKDISMEDIIRAAVPYCIMGFAATGLIIAFPQIALWLPRLAR